MAQASEVAPVVAGSRPRRSLGSLYRSMELDTRLVGMFIALIIMWIGFDRMSGGLFLWNLSVQSSAVAVMATGMVLIIVSRNIDLSVGSILGLTGYTMAMVQAVWIPTTLHLGWEQPYTFLVALAVGITLGALIGGFHGVIIAYIGVPSFIVTLGGLLAVSCSRSSKDRRSRPWTGPSRSSAAVSQRERSGR
jgi:D-xylose transport system permease protein